VRDTAGVPAPIPEVVAGRAVTADGGRRYRLLITTWQDFGAGSIQSVQNLAEGLHERGHHVRVATPADGVLGRRLAETGVPLIDFRFGRGWSVGTARRLAALIRRERFDLVDAQESRDRKAAILARWLFRAPGKLLISRRQMSFTAAPENAVYGAAVDVVVANSHGVARSLRGVPRRKICVVQSGHNPRRIAGEVATGEIEELRSSLGLDPALPTVGVVARRKDQGALLRALTMVGRPSNVLFVGIERDAELERLERRLPEGSNVVYTGFVKRPRPYYSLLDVKVLPSYNEGLPQALFEAMAVGVPVVSSIIGGTPEMIRDGENGFLFRNGDEATLAACVTRLLDEPSLRGTMIEAGRRTATEEYTVDAYVRRSEELYAAVIEGRPLPGRVEQ
jgi:glycosyltransferase involved in cell wall biosynthesis